MCDQFPKECTRKTKNSIVQVEENGRKFLIKNKSKKQFCVVKIDGCYPISGIKCDYLIYYPEKEICMFIELKGKDLKHAVAQLTATIKALSKSCKSIEAYAVLSATPKINTALQNEIRNLRNQGIRFDSKNGEYCRNF